MKQILGGLIYNIQGYEEHGDSWEDWENSTEDKPQETL